MQSDTEILLRLLISGEAIVDASTKEIRFRGMRYSTYNNDWSAVLDVMGRATVMEVLRKAFSGN